MLERGSKGFKVSREGKCAMMGLPSLPGLSLQRCASQLLKTRELCSLCYASWGERRIYASERTKGYTENYNFSIYTPIGRKVSIGTDRDEDDSSKDDLADRLVVRRWG